MKKEPTFDELPLKYRFLVRFLSFAVLSLAAYALSIDGWHNELHFMVCAVLIALSLYFLAGSLVLGVCLVAIKGGSWMGSAFLFARRLFRRKRVV